MTEVFMGLYHSIKPGKPWYDTQGKRIQAHGGSMLFWEGTFYWYGENKEGVTDEKVLWHNGVRMYSSKDLYNWKDEGVICATHPEDPESPLHPYSKMDRPHILYNDKTKKFVLWMKIMGDGGREQYMVTATSDKITGPFRIVNEKLHPGGMNSGDFDLVKREDGSACIVFERVHSDMIVIDLTDDYLDTTLTYSVHLPRKCPPYVREAPAVFHRQGKHYIITSGTTAKFPNASETVRYDDIHGEWEELGDPFVGDIKRTSFDSQVSCVFKYPYADDLYIAMADRWLTDLSDDRPDIAAIFAAIFDPDIKSDLADFPLHTLTAKNTSLADYVWLPVKFVDGVPKIEWRDEWTIEELIEKK
jgi:hypothetical protein